MSTRQALVSASRAGLTVRRTALAAARRFAGWLNGYGETSQDPYDFLVSPLGARAKSLYHRQRLLGAAAVAPFVAVDLVAPHTRVLLLPDVPAVLDRLVTDLTERWTLADGHFVTRELAVGRNAVPYHHWAQSQAFRAVAVAVVGAGEG
jgi:hypothetical protein